MELSFLSGQIELMLNLLNGYFEQVDIKDWRILADTMEDKKDYLEKIIQNSEKTRIKSKMSELYPQLLEKLKS